MASPTVSVAIAFDSGYLTPAASRTWTDVSAYVEAQDRVTINLGRGDEQTTVQPSRLQLTLDNTDGRFTPENASGAYYPNVKKGRPIRVQAAIPGNLLSANDASVETSAGGWTASGVALPTVSRTSAQFLYGGFSLRTIFPASAGTSRALLNVTGLTIGETYTFSAYLYASTAGTPDSQLEVGGIGSGSPMTVKTAWTRATYTFVATATSHNLQIARISGSSAAGTVFADGMMLQTGTDATEFTTSAPSSADLFTGYVDEWPVEWPGGSDDMSTVTITATSRMARLGRSGELKSIVEEAVLAPGPDAYWTMGDPEGSTTAAESSGNSQASAMLATGTGTAVVFGQATGPGTDGLTAATFAAGKYLVWPGSIDVTVFTTITLRATIKLDALPPSNGFAYVIEVADKTETPRGPYITTAGEVAIVGVTGPNINDGGTHDVVVTLSPTNPAQLYVDGVLAGSAGPFGILEPDVTSVRVGRNITGVISHAAVYAGVAVTSTQVADQAEAVLTGFQGDTSGERVARYAAFAGIPTAEIAAETGLSTISAFDITGMAALEAMENVAYTEDGVVFDGRDGTLTFHARSHRYGASSSFTLDTAEGDIEEGFLPRLDDQNLTNDMTVSRPNGATVRSKNDASIAEYGYYRETATIYSTSDNDVQSRADWEVQRYGTPRVTVPNLKTDVTTSSQQSALLSADIGTRFTVTNLPSQAPSTTMDFFIEGITYDIGPESFTVEFNTSAATYANVWQLNSASFSQLDSTTVLAY